MVQNAIRSVRSLIQTTDPDPADIHLYFTPPVKEKDIDLFRQLGATAHRAQTRFPGGFRTRIGDAKAEYAEKWRLTNHNEDTVVFLDCDTVVLDDLNDVITGDFEFKARPIEAADPAKFRALCERFDRTPQDWYPNTGFLVFKHGTHQSLRDDWERFIRDVLPYYAEGYTKEQFALALAATECEFQPMTPNEHVMEWIGDTTPDGYVYHLANGDVDLVQELLNAVDGHLPTKIRTVIGERFPQLYDGIER